MSYVLLVMEPLGQRAQRDQTQGQAAYDSMVKFAEGLREQGKLLAVESLTTGSTRVESQAGRTVVLDGPFAEAKEMVGGFFLLNCASREEALDIAARCPAAAWAPIEVRETGPCFA